MRLYLSPVMILALSLSACASYEPHSKKAVYDPQTQEVIMPYPCPDWSHVGPEYSNALDSNYGCAVENNIAVQLEDPRDLHRGHGTTGPDIDTNRRVIERYRAGELPQPLTPMQQGNTR